MTSPVYTGGGGWGTNEEDPYGGGVPFISPNLIDGPGGSLGGGGGGGIGDWFGGGGGLGDLLGGGGVGGGGGLPGIFGGGGIAETLGGIDWGSILGGGGGGGGGGGFDWTQLGTGGGGRDWGGGGLGGYEPICSDATLKRHVTPIARALDFLTKP